MKAILNVKGGFTKTMEVQDPPPNDLRMAVEEDTANINYKDQQDLSLYDVVCSQKVFRLVGISDPEDALNSLRTHYEQRGMSGESFHYHSEIIWRQHEAKYGTRQAVAIYEELADLTPPNKIKDLVDKAHKLAVERGLIVDVPVESTDEGRFIDLDNGFQDA